MPFNVAYPIQTVGIERYTDEKNTCLEPSGLQAGGSYAARLILRPRQTGQVYPEEFHRYAADILVRIDEIGRRKAGWIRTPSHPNIYDLDLVASQIDSNEAVVGEPVKLALSNQGIIYNRGHIGMPPLRFHTELGYFPGERMHEQGASESLRGSVDDRGGIVVA